MKAIVIVAEGLPCGYLGCYGNEWIQTPNLDRLAAEGVVFDQHVADRPDPAGARHAWRTGCYRFPVPDRTDAFPAPSPDDLIGWFAGHGVATALVLDESRLVSGDFVTGWPQVFRADAAADDPVGSLEQVLQRTGEALDQLGSHEHWLLWLDLATLLAPWEIPEEYQYLYFNEEDAEEEAPEKEEEEEELEAKGPLRPWTGPLPENLDPEDTTTFRRLQGSFAGVVTFLDEGLGLLRDELAARQLLDDVALVVTSGYGLALGEHGVAAAAVPWLHEERTHLPLLIRLPKAAEAGRRVFAMTQSVDLPPTLLALFGLPGPMVHGGNLLPLCRGEAEAVRAYACSGLRTGESIEWALRTPQWAFLLPIFQGVEDAPRPAQLYVKPDDRWEVNNLYQHHPELTQHLEETLRGFVEATRRPGPLQAPELRDIETENQEAALTNEDTPTTGGTEP
jgi:arylsulfatase A-like enzyme